MQVLETLVSSESGSLRLVPCLHLPRFRAMNVEPKSANKPKKESEPDDPSRDENHDESRENPLDKEQAEQEGEEE
jgi:hypothetical protein